MAREDPGRRAHRIRISRYLFGDGHGRGHGHGRDDNDEASNNDTCEEGGAGEETIEAFARRCLEESRRVV